MATRLSSWTGAESSEELMMGVAPRMEHAAMAANVAPGRTKLGARYKAVPWWTGP